MPIPVAGSAGDRLWDARWSHDHNTTGPQKFHAAPVPRIGGVAILIGLLVAGVGLLPIQQRFSIDEFGYLLLAGLLAFAGGWPKISPRKSAC